MNPVRVGVLGVGTWGEKHARVYAALAEASLVGVYDQDAARASAVAAQHGTRAFADPDALLAECEAVSIAVPTTAHRACFERAAAAGRHALVEKPMAGTVEDADRMLAAASRAGVRLEVGQVERFNPALIAVRPRLAGIKFVEAHRLALFQPRSLDIDVVFDLMIHDLDIVLDLMGKGLPQVSAVGVAVLSRNEDIANARIEFADGAVANLTASRVSQERLRRIRFFQDDAYASVDLFARTAEFLHVDRAALARGAGLEAIRRGRIEIPEGEPLTLELRAFLMGVRGAGPGAASGRAGRDALHVAAEVRAAMQARARQWTLGAGAAS